MKTTTENNRLIAEFMGNTPYLNKKGLYEYMAGEKAPIVSTGIEGIWDWLLKYRLSYDSNWNELMPVVEKIERLGYFIMAYEFIDDETNKKSGEFWAQVSNNLSVSIDSLINITGCSSKKEATYKAVVQFIEWWNEQKEK